MKLDFFNIEKGKTIINLGAGRGGATEFYSKLVGDSGLVVSLEPVFENFRLLVKTIVDNGLTNVIPMMTAISDKTGRSRMFLADIHVSHSLVFDKGRGSRIVPTISWDDLMACLNLEHVELAKVDIEGSETLLLKGMSKLIPHYMIIEEHARRGTDLKLLERLLHERGFEIDMRVGMYYYVKLVS